MRKLIVILLICTIAFSLIACGSVESTETTSDNKEDKVTEAQNISQSDIIGNYIEKDSGASLRIEDEYVYWTNTSASFWSEPYENGHSYKIEGDKLTTPVTKEGWDSFEIASYGSGYSLSNDVYTFIPFDDYYSFEHVSINRITDKINGDSSSITLLGVEYLKSIDILEYVTEMWVDSYRYSNDFILEAPDGKCFVKLHILLENEGKETYNVADNLFVSLVYDNSYVFNSYETDGNSIIAEPMNYCCVSGGGVFTSGDLNISPLSSRELTVYMLCPSALMENTDKPLCAAFTIRGEKANPNVLVFDLR